MGTVLVVDDDDDIRDIVAMVLRRRALEVHACADPVAGLAFAETQGCAVAIVDWSMPGMDGGELCERLRALPGFGEVPIVVLTAHADAATHERALAAGASRFLTKPFALKEFGDLVVELVGAPVPAQARPSSSTR